MRSKILLTISLILGLASPAVFAAPVTTELTGVVNAATGIYGDIAIGSAVDIFFTVDPSQASATLLHPNSQAVYSNSNGVGVPFVSSEVFVNGVNVTLDPSIVGADFTSPNQIQSTDSGGRSSAYNLSQQFIGAHGSIDNVFSISAARNASAYSPDGAIPELATGDTGRGDFNDNLPNGGTLGYTVTSEATVAGLPGASVPAPLSVGLLALGLLGAGLRRRTPKVAMLG